MKNLLLLFVLQVACCAADVVAPPYLQNLSPDSVDIYWVETEARPRSVEALGKTLTSSFRPAPQLDFHPEEVAEFPDLARSPKRYLHHCKLTGFQGKSLVEYSVRIGEKTYHNWFKPAPTADQPVYLSAFGDSETEPESTGKPVEWATEQEPHRRYLVDQTEGIKANLEDVRTSQPDALLIAGDLVESGGEQRDWDEFWRRFSLTAGLIPLVTSPGNHEYYAGPKHGKYTDAGSRWAIAKYRTYFHPTGSDTPPMFYRKDIGPVSILAIDCVDGLPQGSDQDSNHYLRAAGDFAPDYHPGSAQWKWLETQLADCQKKNRFTAVLFHHCPYSAGPHGKPPGFGQDEDPQSGRPARVLTALFMRYGVAITLCGHDEMFERSEVQGTEVLPDGSERPHTLQVYDVGVAGDGLRGPEVDNPYSKFLAFRDAPEVWRDGVLVSGGRHYGHLDIKVVPKNGGWKATLTPVYLLPKKGTDGGWIFEHRTYPDELVLQSKD